MCCGWGFLAQGGGVGKVDLAFVEFGVSIELVLDDGHVIVE